MTINYKNFSELISHNLVIKLSEINSFIDLKLWIILVKSFDNEVGFFKTIIRNEII